MIHDTSKDYQTTTYSQVQERKRISYQIKRVTICSIEADCQLMKSLQRPVKFTILASNGQRYSFLAKTGDEMTLEARVSELIQMFDFFRLVYALFINATRLGKHLTLVKIDDR